MTASFSPPNSLELFYLCEAPNVELLKTNLQHENKKALSQFYHKKYF